jgi:tRNA (guanine37-N1)-methyltransferase
MFDSYLNESILARAQAERKIRVFFYNPRDFVKPTKTQKRKEKPYLRIDDKPYGGGPGMVMQALPILRTIEKVIKRSKRKPFVVWLAPDGMQFETRVAKKVSSKYDDVIIICGRYEGIDERVRIATKAISVSVGPYVLTGGELPAMIIIDTIARQIEGVLGNFDSREEERVSSGMVYTRPEVIEYKGKRLRVPKILLSGDHKKIDEWRLKNRTKKA